MKINNIPCTLNFSEQPNHSNLLKVKLVVMHEGANRNGSSFSMKAIDNAKESLKNVPILGYILRADDGEALDFDEHNMSINLVKGENGYELQEFYEEQVIGIIPETNDYHYELIDGVNHVCCTGYIFKSYSNGGADLVANCDSKGVSMEIAVNSGNLVDDIYHIENYQYQAVTILGDHVPQGMNGTCNIKKFSLNNNTKETIKSICEEIQKLNQRKEDTFMEDAKKVEFEETRKEDEVLEEKAPTLVEETVENTNEEIVEETLEVEKEEIVEEQIEEVVETVEAVEEDGEEFASAKKEEDEEQPEEEPVQEESEVSEELEETNETDEEDEEKKKDKFSLECFNVFFDEVPATLSEVCEALLEKFNLLNSELEELREFKATIQKESLIAEVDEVCAEFDFTDEEISEVKEKAYTGEMTIAEFKKELFALTGMKALANKGKFSQKEATVKQKIAVVETEKIKVSNEPYGGLFTKYGIK